MGKKRQKIKGSFVAIPFAMICSVSWQELTGNTVKFYVEIRKRNWEAKKSGTEFIIPYSYYKNRLHISKPVFYKSLKELCANGFLEKTKFGGLLRNASEYKFSDNWTDKKTGTTW